MRTRQSLVRAAAEVFAQSGFTTAALASISERAGVSAGALHFHFANKQELARAVEDEAAAAVRSVVERVSAAGPNPLQRLVDATHALMGRPGRDVVVRAGFELGSGLPRRDGAMGLHRVWRDWVEEVLGEAEREGVLAEGVSAADASAAVVAATVGFELLGSDDRTRTSATALTGFWELLLPRLAAAEGLGRLVSCGTPDVVPGDA
ncbi:ScbR family autoregulator-binding transcription factor [Streptomyces tsukubensis]|uniref:ScbR family autoregulator-binding transcription factor n=1 Tax=Streptomyces tsukubensis TaxID=83656 RepID=UPI00344B9917